MDEEDQRKKNLADAARWAASKYDSKRYSGRVDFSKTGKIDVTKVLFEASARARRNPLDILNTASLDQRVNSLTETEALLTRLRGKK